MKTEKTNSQCINMHINNGGIKFEIEKLEFNTSENHYAYPVLVIGAQHFGHQTNEMKLQMTPSRMKKMGEWFIKQSEVVDEWYDNKGDGVDPFDGVHSKFNIENIENIN